MSQQQTQPQTAEPIAEAVDGYGQLRPRQVTIFEWRVLSWRNDGLTAYEVNLRDLSCTCPDKGYNRDHPEICAHLAVALEHAPKTIDVAEAVNKDLLDQTRALQDAVDTIERRATGLEADREADRTNGDTAASNGTPETDGTEGTDMEADPDEKADKLREAFESRSIDVQVKAGAERIWLQTGPYAGDKAFNDFLQEPDLVEYVHDDHDRAPERPGEWWQNAIGPGHVDRYINEVLA